MKDKMSAAEVGTALCDVEGWEANDDCTMICKTFTFGGFGEAFGFMTSMAPVCEEMDHHPEWTNVYNRVSVRLTTHDVKGLTPKDFRLAYEMDHRAA